MDHISRKNTPTVFIIFGATGDLTTRKIAPAFFNLYQKGQLPRSITIIGFARRELSDKDFQNHIKALLNKNIKNQASRRQLDHFVKLFIYQQGNFENADDYIKLSHKVSKIDDMWGICSNKLYYLAVPPQYYKNIFGHLHSSGLRIPCSDKELSSNKVSSIKIGVNKELLLGWTRIIVEKPFGKNQKTAQELDKLMGQFFSEDQIYRIDHYLAKEMIQNILTFRFSNNLFEKAWDNRFIEKISIRLLEDIGVEERGGFYDSIGALRDVGQNHLLQMLALVTMSHPIEFKSEFIRKHRHQILQTLKILDEKDIKDTTFRARYNNYNSIKGVNPVSETETYFKIKAFLEDAQWQNVPIYMESGKRMGRSQKEIEIYFRHPMPCLCPSNEHHRNKVIIALEPEERISIKFWVKKPGFEFETEERTFDFLLRKRSLARQYVEEYEKLLLDCIDGDQTLFVSTEEVQAMWRFIDPILSGWEKGLVELKNYKPDSDEISKLLRNLEIPAALNNTPTLSKNISGLKKEIAIIGLGKMGGNIARQLLDKSWRVVGYNRNENVTREMEKEGLEGAYSFQELIKKINPPRLVWLMLTAGQATDEILFGKNGIANQVMRGDTIIDGGNSFYKDSVRRYKKLTEKGINFIDVGFSGGPSGARNGGSLMIGGKKKNFESIELLFHDLSVRDGYQFFEGAGAGHFVKMIHNGIEYGMMQALAEGFAIMKKSKYDLDLSRIAEVYNHGSVVESRLVSWLKDAFAMYSENLTQVSGSVGRTGEGEWTVKTAKELKVKAKIIEEALKFRMKSEKKPSFTGKILSALRNQFGGHGIHNG